MGTPSLHINGRSVGPGNPVYVIAEMSANHNQSFDQAAAILRAAKDAGADAVKIQTYTPDTLTIDCQSECFQIRGTIWDGRTLYDLYQEAFTPWEWQPRLQTLAAELGLDFFSTAFDETAVDFLEGMNVPAYKVASFEMIDLPLLKRLGRTGKPLIVSTGMATLAEIHEAVQTIRQCGHYEAGSELALLKCTSAYPAPAEEMNLRTLPHLADAFQVPVGLSDHTMGVAVPVAAVTLGASIVEKHLTLSRGLGGPDSAFSLEPHEFKAMVEAVRVADKAVGQVHYGCSGSEAKSRAFRRSLFVTETIRAGDSFTSKNVRSIRPEGGLPPRHLDEVLGRKATRDIPRGTPLSWGLVA